MQVCFCLTVLCHILKFGIRILIHLPSLLCPLLPSKMVKDKSKPKGAMTPYAIFVQQSRDELKKKNPTHSVDFTAFSKDCSSKWKALSVKEKKKFEDLAAKDKERFAREMKGYSPPKDAGKKDKKKKKDPNAPKRPMSAFFFFCADERSKVKKDHPEWKVSDIAKELGHRWEACKNRSKYEGQAETEKSKYEKAMAKYKSGK
ncbi:unnamed protein product [Protopolystoma xenopodis]|uniref:HMG box domain-containing protein n=1 Tax=Protopolystoma xenopodis TaxID=117903 RepID=A0A448X3U2_9PLAT|nr:unnamed protein product [Protopolystoma xenopodis]